MKSSQNGLIEHIKTLLESNELYLEKIKRKDTAPFQKETLCIAIIINAWSALEGYINFIASIAKFAGELESYEKSLLEEVDWKLNDKGKFEKQIAYHSTTKKFLFLLTRFSSVNIAEFKKGSLWREVRIAEEKRNHLIHPKETIEEDGFSFKTAEATEKTARLAISLLEKKVLKSKNSILG